MERMERMKIRNWFVAMIVRWVLDSYPDVVRAVLAGQGRHVRKNPKRQKKVKIKLRNFRKGQTGATVGAYPQADLFVPPEGGISGIGAANER